MILQRLKLFLPVCFCWFCASCTEQKNVNDGADKAEMSDSLIDRLYRQKDSLERINHMVIKDSSFIFDSPGIQSRKKYTLQKGDLISGVKTDEKFMHIVYVPYLKDTVEGWILSEDIGRIQFTPPVINSDKK